MNRNSDANTEWSGRHFLWLQFRAVDHEVKFETATGMCIPDRFLQELK